MIIEEISQKQHNSFCKINNVIYKLSNEFCDKYKLSIGISVSEELFSNIQKEDMKLAIKNKLDLLLVRRFHSKKELSNKLLKSFNNYDLINEILTHYTSKGLIDDNLFMNCFINDKINLTSDGYLKIKYKLLEKGISEDKIPAKNKFIDEEEYFSRCKLLAEKKLRKISEKDFKKKKEKLIRFLLNKGFEKSIIFQSINTLEL